MSQRFCLFNFRADQEFMKLKLSDLSIVATLGVGGFGRVELVGPLSKMNRRSFEKYFKCVVVSKKDLQI